MRQVNNSFIYGIFIALVAVVVLVHAGSENAAEIGKTAPGFELTDSNGKTHKLSDYKGKYVVLEWTNFQCPFVRKHYDTGNMQKLQKTYGEKDVVWLSICSSAPGNQGYFKGKDLDNQLKTEKTNAHAYLMDADGTVGRRYGASTTPHMFIIDKDQTLIYAGAIDDKATTRKSHVATADNYVVRVLNHVLSGKESPVKATAPYGCSVKY